VPQAKASGKTTPDDKKPAMASIAGFFAAHPLAVAPIASPTKVLGNKPSGLVEARPKAPQVPGTLGSTTC
jgi:hypothetical protein